MCMGPPTFYRYFAFIAWVYPHVYGATRVLVFTHRTELGLSPCVWGHLPLGRSSISICGTIPMSTVATFVHKKSHVSWRAYPHASRVIRKVIRLLTSLL